MPRRASLAILGFAVLLVTGDLTGEPLAPPSPGAFLVTRDFALVRLAPSPKARRRGEVRAGARLPILEQKLADGCSRSWFKVHADSWICGEQGRVVTDPPGAPLHPVLAPGALTPWPYGFVREPTLEYRPVGSWLEEERELLKGFGFGVAGAVTINGTSYYRTTAGNLVARRGVGITDRVSRFAGLELGDTITLPRVFVNSGDAWTYRAPSRGRGDRVAPASRYASFALLEERVDGRKRFLRVGEGEWLAGEDVRVARLSEPPPGLGEDERWIDVDLGEQVLVAYAGRRPVFATLVSTGRNGPSRTPPGSYRIWAKVAAIAMDNTDEELEAAEPASAVVEDPALEDSTHLFSLHDVPWTQFFEENYALHGVYWHDRFGNKKSHGCVNLSPQDAAWLFRFTAPVVPPGFWAVHTSPTERGTLVRVR